MYAWDSQQLAGSKVVLSRDHVVQRKKLLLKLRICRWSEVVGGDQFSSRRSKYVITPPTPPTPPYPPTMRRLVCVQVQGTLSSHPPHPTTRRLVCLQVQGTISSHPPHPTHPTHPTTSVDYYVCKSKYVTIPPTHPPYPPTTRTLVYVQVQGTLSSHPPHPKGVCMYKWCSRSSCMYKWRRHAQVT